MGVEVAAVEAVITAVGEVATVSLLLLVEEEVEVAAVAEVVEVVPEGALQEVGSRISVRSCAS